MRAIVEKKTTIRLNKSYLTLLNLTTISPMALLLIQNNIYINHRDLKKTTVIQDSN